MCAWVFVWDTIVCMMHVCMHDVEHTRIWPGMWDNIFIHKHMSALTLHTPTPRLELKLQVYTALYCSMCLCPIVQFQDGTRIQEELVGHQMGLLGMSAFWCRLAPIYPVPMSQTGLTLQFVVLHLHPTLRTGPTLYWYLPRLWYPQTTLRDRKLVHVFFPLFTLRIFAATPLPPISTYTLWPQSQRRNAGKDFVLSKIRKARNHKNVTSY